MLIRRMSILFLWIIPLPFLSVAYRPGELRRYMLAGAVQAALIGVAAWTITRRRDHSNADEDDRRRPETIVAAVLLVLGWAIASLALNMEAPPIGQAWLATQTDQHVRYGALVAGFVVAPAGLTVLAACLFAGRERTASIIGGTVATMSAVLFTVLFAPYPHILTARFTAEAASGAPPAWWALFRLVFSSIEIVQRLLMYAATVLFAIGLRRGRLLGGTAVASLVGLTLLVAGANVVIHIPPAVPLMLPYWMGIALMQRAGALPQRRA